MIEQVNTMSETTVVAEKKPTVFSGIQPSGFITMRDDTKRSLLFELDAAIQSISGEAPDHPSALRLTGVYHNLLRQWAEL